jgi:hypothetical protein
MRDDEVEEPEGELSESCSLCGGTILGGAEPGFAFGLESVLCWSCALRRGGRYDGELERWVGAPDVSDLSDEKYGSSPHERRRVR